VAGDALRSRVILPRLGPLPGRSKQIATPGSRNIGSLSDYGCHHITIGPPQKNSMLPVKRRPPAVSGWNPSAFAALPLVFPAAMRLHCADHPEAYRD
jgi:hypothetical protein